jgi:hypothetical protein
VFKPTKYGYEPPINDASKTKEQYSKNVCLHIVTQLCGSFCYVVVLKWVV